ncbi:juvenile hormone acid O-methyltransferase-like [Dendronephthya gigantea]|uniref:juvenile hormone acid O-methyltransferase-like n=1 Tax=Dendronephthya gigantea TaxID=151771 RepID=UPI00106DCEA5|nr:juvenile hormone acid O-methyltransferase-like [Dendronephthya gigantea]
MACAKNSQTNAALYSTFSSIQYKAGCSFLETLNLKLGDKVLDMGCGTGELTKYIAERVGHDGEVVGVDPDHTRIKVAHENMTVPNASFHTGRSESGFPNDNQAYYDLHFSNHVFHWLNDEDKAAYVKVAFNCLKSGGVIAVQCLAKPDDDINNRFIESALSTSLSPKCHFAEEGSARELLHDVGFTHVDVKIIPSVCYYSSFEVYSKGFLAAACTDISELADKALLEEFKMKSIEKDGRVKSKYNLFQIKGRKS